MRFFGAALVVLALAACSGQKQQSEQGGPAMNQTPAADSGMMRADTTMAHDTTGMMHDSTMMKKDSGM
jgi:hypothetical protein